MLPYQIVTGGVTGIAAIVFYATGLHISLTYFVINFALLIAALKILGLKFMIKTIYAIFMLSFFLYVAQNVMTSSDGQLIRVLGENNTFMSLVIGCCLTGTSLAIVFLHNGSTGGTDIVAAIVNKYHNLSLGTVLIFVDILIIGSSFPVFGEKYGYEMGLRIMVTGLCAMMIENFVLDYVMNARRESVQFLIFSRKYDEIAYAIGTKLDHGVTILDGHGWYTGNEVKVLCIPATQERECRHLPHDKDHRPQRLREPERCHRRLRRGLRPHKGEGHRQAHRGPATTPEDAGEAGGLQGKGGKPKERRSQERELRSESFLKFN